MAILFVCHAWQLTVLLLRCAGGLPFSQINSLTGTIPPDLCWPSSPLRVLNLRGNRLEGPAAAVEECTQLESLDIGFNQLTGSVPASPVGFVCGGLRGGRVEWLWGGEVWLLACQHSSMAA